VTRRERTDHWSRIAKTYQTGTLASSTDAKEMRKVHKITPTVRNAARNFTHGAR
jgi:hypothetical protein